MLIWKTAHEEWMSKGAGELRVSISSEILSNLFSNVILSNLFIGLFFSNIILKYLSFDEETLEQVLVARSWIFGIKYRIGESTLLKKFRRMEIVPVAFLQVELEGLEPIWLRDPQISQKIVLKAGLRVRVQVGWVRTSLPSMKDCCVLQISWLTFFSKTLDPSARSIGAVIAEKSGPNIKRSRNLTIEVLCSAFSSSRPSGGGPKILLTLEIIYRVYKSYKLKWRTSPLTLISSISNTIFSSIGTKINPTVFLLRTFEKKSV